MDLKDLMDPKRLEAQTKYENARYAVSESYRIACKEFSYLQPKKAYKTNEKGERVRDYENDQEASEEERFNHMASMARRLAVAIEADLNATLSRLEDGSKTKPS